MRLLTKKQNAFISFMFGFGLASLIYSHFLINKLSSDVDADSIDRTGINHVIQLVRTGTDVGVYLNAMKKLRESNLLCKKRYQRAGPFVQVMPAWNLNAV